MARMLKDEGNMYMKQKEIAKAISKWCKVTLYTKSFLPSKGGEDLMLSMVRKHKTLDKDQQEEMINLQAVTDLNMATAFFRLKRYDKCIQKATLSLDLKKTI